MGVLHHTDGATNVPRGPLTSALLLPSDILALASRTYRQMGDWVILYTIHGHKVIS